VRRIVLCRPPFPRREGGQGVRAPTGSGNAGPGSQVTSPTWRRRPVLLALAGALGWSIEWRSRIEDPSLRRVRDSGHLRVALDPSNEPFSAVDGSGQLGGLDVDLSRLLGTRLGVATELIALDAGGLFESVVARKSDLAVGVPPVREFTNDLRYSRPYFNTGSVAVMNSGLSKSSGQQPTFEVEAGSVADSQLDAVRRRLGTVAVERAPDLDEMLASLRAGEVAGLVLDLATARRLARDDPSVVLVSEPLTWEPLVFAAHKNDSRLLQEVNAILDFLEQEGVLRDLSRQWVG
jgi:polar amino acid transport system substrate-binding protein